MKNISEILARRRRDARHVRRLFESLRRSGRGADQQLHSPWDSRGYGPLPVRSALSLQRERGQAPSSAHLLRGLSGRGRRPQPCRHRRRGHRALPFRGPHPRRHRRRGRAAPRRALPAPYRGAGAGHQHGGSGSFHGKRSGGERPAFGRRREGARYQGAHRHDLPHGGGPGARSGLGPRRPLRHHARGLPHHGHPQDGPLLRRGAAGRGRHRGRRRRRDGGGPAQLRAWTRASPSRSRTIC